MESRKIIFWGCCTFLLLPGMENPPSKIVPSTFKTLAIAGALKIFYTDDGHSLVVDAHNGVGNTIAVRNTENYEQGVNISIPPNASIITLSPDYYAITTDLIHPLVKWDIYTGQHEIVSEQTLGAAIARYDTSGQRLVFSNDQDAFLLDLKSNKIVKKMIADNNTEVVGLACNPLAKDEVGISFARKNDAGTEWGLWDLIADKMCKLTTVMPHLTSTIQFDTNGNALVCGALDQFIHCTIKTGLLTYYALNGEKRDWPFKSQDNSLFSASVVPGRGTVLCAGSEKNRVVYCDMNDASQSLMFNPAPHNTSNVITAVAIHPSGKQMAVATVDDKNESVIKILSLSEC